MARMSSSSQAPSTSIRQSAAATAAPSATAAPRIPATLQSVFLASNRGKTVHKPPPEKVASKTFFRNWLFQKQSHSGRKSSNVSSITATVQRSYKGLWSIGGYNNNNNNNAGTNSGNNSAARNCPSPPATTTGKISPINISSIGSTNGSKYKMNSSKKQTDALVTAAIAAAERLSHQQQLQQQQQQQQQQQPKVQSSAQPSVPPSTPVSSTPRSTGAGSAVGPVPPAFAVTQASATPSSIRRAAEVTVTDLSETEQESSSSSSSSIASTSASPSMTTTPVASIPATPKEVVVEEEVMTMMSPQDYLDNLLESRGYSTRRFQTLQTAYYNKPTPLQTASYHVHLINLARQGECHSFCALLSSGLSPNPANLHGESLLHTVCRRGLHQVLAAMLEKCATSVAVADDYGRTPLHDAMWNNTVSLHTIDLLLKHGDATTLFLMQDARGALPLSYARKQHWPIWKDFIDKVKDQYWPQLDGNGKQQHELSPLLLAPPNSHPLEDPIHALPLEVAVLVASGKMSPAEAVFLVEDDDDDDSECDSDDDMSEGSYDSEDDDDCDSEDDDDSTTSSWDEEMSDMLESLPIRK